MKQGIYFLPMTSLDSIYNFGVGKKKTLWIVVLIALPVVILPAFFIFYRRKRKLKEKGDLLLNNSYVLCLSVYQCT